MSKRRGNKGRGPLGQTLSDEVSAVFIEFGQKLAARTAEGSFQAVTAVPSWTLADVEAASEIAIAQMEIALRDALTAERGDLDDRPWQEIWTAMERCYRKTTANLLRGLGLRVGRLLH